MTNPAWGTKRTCPNCNAHFYDLNKPVALCPKCKHQFDPAVQARGRRKATKREAADEKDTEIMPTILPGKKAGAHAVRERKNEDADEGLGDIAEMDDDIESLDELSEIGDMEEAPGNDDDADDETIIEEMNAGDKTLVENIEEEEARVFDDENEDEAPVSKQKQKKMKE